MTKVTRALSLVFKILQSYSRDMRPGVKLKTNQSQFLVTEDYRIVANDLDDLPEVIPDNLPNCTWGKIEDRDPSFQSPEEKSYSPNNPSPFTDKADVWKLVNMTKFIMYKVSQVDISWTRDSRTVRTRPALDQVSLPPNGCNISVCKWRQGTCCDSITGTDIRFSGQVSKQRSR